MLEALGSVSTQAGQEQDAQARDFTDPLPIKIRIPLEGGKTERKLQVVVHRWEAASAIDPADPEDLQDPAASSVRGSSQ